MSDEIETIDKNPKSWAAWKMEAERLQEIIDGIALAAMDSEPVAYIDKHWTLVYYVPPMSMGLKIGDKLYRHAQQPVVPDNRAITQHFDTIALETAREILCDVNRRHEFLGGEVQLLSRVQCRIDEACRAAMLQENAKSAGESNNCRSNEKVQDLQAGNCREIAETSTGTAITPAAPDKKLTDDVLDEIIAGAKTSMEQYLALSLKAEREVWRKEGPTDDERIMAIEGIHNCERCGDEGWVVGEMGITRCACGHPGNSPVIPDGYRLQPISEYEAMRATINSDEWPQRWIPVSERLPENKPGCYEYLVFETLNNRINHDYWNVPDTGDDDFAPFWNHYGDSVTHWMPLPAAPQEVKGE